MIIKPKSITAQNGGFSLLEANIAIVLTLITMVGSFAANTNFLALLKSANHASAASQSVQERVEQMRIANWLQITDSNYLKANLISSPTASARTLPNCTETVTITPYPAPETGSAPIKLVRSNGQVTVESANAALKKAAMVKVEWNLRWKAAAAEPVRSRSGTVLLAKGGIVK